MLQYFPDGPAMIVAAANDGGATDPGWYRNLTSDPAAWADVMGRTFGVRAAELPPDEAGDWWARILQRDPTYERYARATGRTIPIIRLVPETG